MAFTVTHTRHDRFTHLRLTGELDMSTAPRLNACVDELLDAGQHRLLVDLRELDFCDSTGLAAFVRGDGVATGRGGWLRLVGATGPVARVLRISGLAELLDYREDQPDPAMLGDR